MRLFRLALPTLLVAACGGGSNDSGDPPPVDAHSGSICDDGVDNDNDGKTDYPDDPGCIVPQGEDETDDCPSGSRCAQCGNGMDDDGNGAMDYPGDPGCDSAGDLTEYTAQPFACGASMTVADLPPTGTVDGTLDIAASSSQLTSGCTGVGVAAIAYRIEVTSPSVIVASTSGSTADTVLALRGPDCDDAGAELTCHNDVSAENRSSSITYSVQPGNYFLVVAGADTTVTGAFTLQVEKFAGEGTPCTDTAMCGPGLVCRTPLGGPAMVCSKPQCGDTLDDDGDSKNGYPTDPGCTSLDDNDETDPTPLPACGNGIDDDGDNQIDYPADTSCTSASGGSEACNAEQDAIASITTGTATGTLVGSHDDHEPACGGSFTGNDVAFTVNLPAMRSVRIDTNGSAVDTVLSLLGATCAEPSLACNDEDPDAVDNTSRILRTNLPAGAYVLVVDNYSDDPADDGPLTLHVSGTIAPGGACDAGATLGGALACPASNPCMTIGGVLRCEPAACGDGIDNDADGTSDYPMDPGCAATDDADEADSCAMGPSANCPQCADGIDNDGDNQIDAADPSCDVPSGTSEACTTAEPVTELVLPLTAGDTNGTTSDFMPACGFDDAGDLTYAVRLPALATITFTASTDFDAVLALYGATCGGTAVGCVDDWFSLPEELTLTNLAAGTYFLDVDGNAEVGTFDLQIEGTIAVGGSCEVPLAQSGALTCATGATCTGTAGSRTCQM